MLKTLAGFLVGLTLAGGGMAVAQDNPENPPRWMTSPCQYEDSRNCFWDADTNGLGNGGHSFYSIRINRDVECTVYWQNWYAKRNNFCTKGMAR